MPNNSNTQSATTVSSRPLTSETGNVSSARITIKEHQSATVREFFECDNALGHTSELLELLNDWMIAGYDEDGVMKLGAEEIIDKYYRVHQIVKLISVVESADNIRYPALIPVI